MNKEIIQRLARYKNILQRLKSLGFVKVFSDNLGDAAGISPALVRKDFSIANLAVGNKRGGYKIDLLIQNLNHVLGMNTPHRIVIVGCGKIGTALINYQGFVREDIRVVAGFDSNALRLNPEAPIPILPVDELGAFIRREKIKIAVMTVPESAATQILDILVPAGIKGILNFTPVQLKASEDIFIQNINIAMEIENLFYYIHFIKKGNVKMSAVPPQPS
jgi:redox-sensing transcriptional repressor